MKRTISILLTVCMMIALLAGCGSPATAASETPETETVQPAETEDSSKETADLIVFGTIYTAEDETDGLAEDPDSAENVVKYDCRDAGDKFH